MHRSSRSCPARGQTLTLALTLALTLTLTLDQVVRAVRRRYSAAGYPPSAAGRSPPQRSLSAGLPRRSAVERGGSRAIEVSYGGATLVPRLEDERLAEEIGEVILDWT